MDGPVLQFKDEKGEAHAEHIPGETLGYEYWFSEMRDKLAGRFGWDTYWWHVDHLYPPEMRKRYDMHFLRHVEVDHDGEPEDRREGTHYRYLKNLYKHEYAWAVEQLDLQRAYDEDPDGDLYPHAYSYSYHIRWWSADPAKEWKLLYHGVSLREALDLLEEDFVRLGWDKKRQVEADEAG